MGARPAARALGTISLGLSGPLAIVTGWFPPRPSGTSTILGNLVAWLRPEDYFVITGAPPGGEAKTDLVAGARTYHVTHNLPLGRKGQQLWGLAQVGLAAVQIARLCHRERAAGVLAVFPDVQYTLAAYLAWRFAGMPFAAYLHDCMAENEFPGYMGWITRHLQAGIFGASRPLFVMSQAMSDHLQSTYGLAAIPLVHCYNEPIPDEVPAGQPNPDGLRLMFSGAIGVLNGTAMARLTRAIGRVQSASLSLLGYNLGQACARFAIGGPHVTSGFIGDRQKLLEQLRAHDVLVACLAWPDESEVGAVELRTIFSTKIPEYLAQGRPVLIHAPENYAISAFITEHECGWVISSRDEADIAATLRTIAGDPAERRRRGRNALRAAHMFEGSAVASGFAAALAGEWRHSRY